MAADFLREPQHVNDAKHQIDSIWHCHGCWCDDCSADGAGHWLDWPSPGENPLWDALALYSALALTEAVAVLDREFPDWHVRHPSLQQWLDVLRNRHRTALELQAELDGIDMALVDRSRSARPPARWMGRSPGYYSRGR